MNRSFFFQPLSAAPRRIARRSGQSLVEFSLTLPILLLIIVGVVEVGNILLAYNEVQLLAREGARQAARGVSDEQMLEVILQSIKDPDTGAVPARFGEDLLTIWIVRPEIETEINPAVTTDPTTWYWSGGPTDGSDYGATTPAECMYGDVCGSGTESLGLSSSAVLDNIAQIAETTGQGGLDGEVFTVVVIQYRVRLVLNIPIYDPGGTGTDEGFFPIQAFAVIREEAPPPSEAIGGGGGDSGGSVGAGCAAFPIGLNLDALDPEGDGLADNVGSTYNLARGEGGQWDFLLWQVSQNNDTALAEILSSSTKSAKSPTWYQGPNGDTILNKGSYVTRFTVSPSTETADVMADHVDTIDEVVPAGYTALDQPRTLLVPVYDMLDDLGLPLSGVLGPPAGDGSTWYYYITNFVLIQIVNDWTDPALEIVFLGEWTMCGQ